VEFSQREPRRLELGAKERVQRRVVGAQPACRAAQNHGSVERAGERLPPSEIAVRGDRASGRSEQTRRNGRALKRASTRKEQKPVRSSEASSARPNYQAARRGLGRPSRVALLAVLTEHRGSPNQGPASHHKGGR